jgi:hypothetical protein
LKKGTIFLLLFFFWTLWYSLLLNSKVINSQNHLIGYWEGEYAGKELTFIFNEDSSCLITFFDMVSDSIIIISGNYNVIYKKHPMSLNIKNIAELTHPLYTIIHFLKNDSIKIAKFSPRWRTRPISFDNKSDIILRRIKNN